MAVITGKNQVGLINDNIIPLQSGSVFYEHPKLNGAQYSTDLYFTFDGNHNIIIG